MSNPRPARAQNLGDLAGVGAVADEQHAVQQAAAPAQGSHHEAQEHATEEHQSRAGDTREDEEAP